MGQIKHYNNGKWTIYTSGEDLSGYTGTTNTYYIGVNNTDGDLSKVNPDGELINIEKEFMYEIGQYVLTEGGVIFHRWKSTIPTGSPEKGAIQNYLVLDTVDLTGATQWATSASTIPNTDSYWDGLTNTVNIHNGGIDGGFDVPAADICYNSTNNGKNDWYLPSVYELILVFNFRWNILQGLINAGGYFLLESVNYWTSTQFDITGAKRVGGLAGNFGNANKGLSQSVRAIRKFSI